MHYLLPAAPFRTLSSQCCVVHLTGEVPLGSAEYPTGVLRDLHHRGRRQGERCLLNSLFGHANPLRDLLRDLQHCWGALLGVRELGEPLANQRPTL
jgi:hypothetical protein